MEELFENKTRYSQKEYEIFLKSYREEYAMSENAYILFNIVFFGMCMIFAFRQKEIILGIILLLGLLFYLWFKIIRPTIKVEKEKKGQKVSGNFINTYRFYKNYFKVENPEGKATVYYFKLYRVVETNTHYYIYISRESAFIVSKAGFIKGNKIEFSSFLKKKIFFKYKTRINKLQK